MTQTSIDLVHISPWFFENKMSGEAHSTYSAITGHAENRKQHWIIFDIYVKHQAEVYLL